MQYVATQGSSTSQMTGNMYSGLEANNLVNFYNSNLLDEMLQKNQGKMLSKQYAGAGNGHNPHLRKSAQSALDNHNTKQSLVHQQNSLLKQ